MGARGQGLASLAETATNLKRHVLPIPSGSAGASFGWSGEKLKLKMQRKRKMKMQRIKVGRSELDVLREEEIVREDFMFRVTLLLGLPQNASLQDVEGRVKQLVGMERLKEEKSNG